MKKSILFALAAIAAFVGCEKAAVNDGAENPEDSYWVFVSEKPAINAETKTEWDGTKVDWSVGDKIKIACYNSTRGKWQDQTGDASKNPKAYSSTALSASDINNGIASFTYQTKFAMNDGGTYRFYSFFPSNLENASSADIADAPILTHASIKNEQPISSTSFDGSSDILVGISTNTYTEQPDNYDKIELKWKRLVAFPVITFKNLGAETGELVKSVTITAQEGAVLTGAVDVNIYNGTTVASNTRTTFNSVSATHSTGVALDANNSFTTWFVTLPFTATSLSVEIVTTAAKYSREIDLTSNTKQFVQNKRNVLAINMAEATKEALGSDDNVYASLAELVAAGKPTSTERTVTVTLTNEEISTKASTYICLDVPTSESTVQKVKLYKSGVPSEWSVGGTVSGTITCPWLLYNSVDWELKPASWSNLTYTAPAASETCATPSISITDEGIATITCTTEGAAIYYTLGNSPADPTNSSTPYTGTVEMTSGETIKAIAYKDGLDPSSVASETYTTGGGQDNGDIYVLCTSVDDLKAGAQYIIASGTSGNVDCMSNASNTNNRKATGATVSNSSIEVASDSEILTLTLGGESGAWTLHTDNYAGTNGYLASAASGKNNYCRIIKEETTCTISFSNKAAVININPHTERTLLRYNNNNGSRLFACYSSGQNPVYLYKKTANNTNN